MHDFGGIQDIFVSLHYIKSCLHDVFIVDLLMIGQRLL